MKKFILLFNILFIIVLGGCSKTKNQSNLQTTDDKSQISIEQNVNSEISSKPITESFEQNSDSESQSDGLTNSSKYNNSSFNTSSSKSSTNEEKNISTIGLPKQTFLYNEGITYKLTDSNECLQAAKTIEEWFVNLKSIPACSLSVKPELIDNIKSSETALEFIYDDAILMYGKNIFSENVRGILIPLTGKYRYYIFKCDENGSYYDAPIAPVANDGNKLETLVNLMKKESIKYCF